MASEMKEELGSPLYCGCPDIFAGEHFCHRSSGNSQEERKVSALWADVDIVSICLSTYDE